MVPQEGPFVANAPQGELNLFLPIIAPFSFCSILLFPFILTLSNAPSVLFEIFPFIFLISSQFFFLELIDKNELEFLKVHGLNNIKIIKILSSTSIILGIFLILMFYQISSQLKFLYFDLKNDYSKDDKYLSVVTETIAFKFGHFLAASNTLTVPITFVVYVSTGS